VLQCNEKCKYVNGDMSFADDMVLWQPLTVPATPSAKSKTMLRSAVSSLSESSTGFPFDAALLHASVQLLQQELKSERDRRVKLEEEVAALKSSVGLLLLQLGRAAPASTAAAAARPGRSLLTESPGVSTAHAPREAQRPSQLSAAAASAVAVTTAAESVGEVISFAAVRPPSKPRGAVTAAEVEEVSRLQSLETPWMRGPVPASSSSSLSKPRGAVTAAEVEEMSRLQSLETPWMRGPVPASSSSLSSKPRGAVTAAEIEEMSRLQSLETPWMRGPSKRDS
jgi:hypothetical protein